MEDPNSQNKRSDYELIKEDLYRDKVTRTLLKKVPRKSILGTAFDEYVPINDIQKDTGERI